MKKLSLLALVAFSMTSCWIARIYTEVPTTKPVVPAQTVYTTQVTTPSPKVTTVTTFVVTNYNTDPCFYLDLNAVAAAFADSRSVREFEQILNSSRYMINNLDLNRDGWIDYLRVIETHRGVYHTFLIQACLGPSLYQDVATLVAEHRPNALYVEVIGDRWLYGPNYIVRPVFIKRPPLWNVFGRPSYAAWTSPYYYGYWPSYYQKPKPIYLNHYQAYVRTYMHDHHYCHQCDYPKQFFYSGYTQMTQPNSHNDYAVRYPDQSFERRVTAQNSVQNAGQLREQTEPKASKPEATTSTSTTTTRTTSGTATTRTSSSTATRTESPASTSTSRTSSTTSSTRTSSGTATTRQPSTSVESRVNKSGTTRTIIRSTDASGRTTTIKRESTNNIRTATGSSSSRTSSGSSATRTRTSNPTGGTSTRR